MGTSDTSRKSATDQLAALQSREISAIELLNEHLERHELLHSRLNAIVTTDIEGARQQAAEIDEAQRNGKNLGPLAGLPMTVKDALATNGMRSTGGAIELTDHVPAEDAAAVAHARNAGAIIWGKSNLPRWSGDIQAVNEMFGRTGNPWDLTKTPGGSSGGAAAAVATCISPVEIGTDIGGSVRLPAHFSGVCGHKPSFGVVPQRGYIDHVTYGALDADVNVVGPLARTVDDLELMMNVLADHPDRLLATRGKGRELRVAAWLDDPACPVSTEVAAVLDTAISALEAEGIKVDRNARPAHGFDDVYSIGMPLVSAATSPGRTDEEYERLLERSNDADPTMAMRARASTIRHRDWLLMSEQRELRRRNWDRFFNDYDVLLAPTAFIAAFEHVDGGNLYTRTLEVDGSTRPYADLIAWTTQFGYVYLPATVVPAGRTPSGLPVGLQIVGPFMGDRTTLEFGRLVESVTGGYKAPPLLP
ncbi:MAG: amidase family protein [Actinobacteria bacterium]|nr:amidase family protein [Actinomycetota bacterium]